MSTPKPERRPVVFIQGLWVHTSAWQPWQDLLAAAGYAPRAPAWTGDAATPAATRVHPEAMAASASPTLPRATRPTSSPCRPSPSSPGTLSAASPPPPSR
jgi:hypothetical protein